MQSNYLADIVVERVSKWSLFSCHNRIPLTLSPSQILTKSSLFLVTEPVWAEVQYHFFTFKISPLFVASPWYTPKAEANESEFSLIVALSATGISHLQDPDNRSICSGVTSTFPLSGSWPSSPYWPTSRRMFPHRLGSTWCPSSCGEPKILLPVLLKPLVVLSLPNIATF